MDDYTTHSLVMDEMLLSGDYKGLAIKSCIDKFSHSVGRIYLTELIGSVNRGSYVKMEQKRRGSRQL